MNSNMEPSWVGSLVQLMLDAYLETDFLCISLATKCSRVKRLSREISRSVCKLVRTLIDWNELGIWGLEEDSFGSTERGNWVIILTFGYTLFK